MSTTRGPNVISVAWSVYRSLRVSPPEPSGTESADHGLLGAVLDTLQREGIAALPSLRSNLAAYRDDVAALSPDNMSRREALAFWLNLYNAGALDLAAEAVLSDRSSVLRVPGAFTRPWANVAGEDLSLMEIEHGKIRRLGDPRIHGALVCGSASCPSLRLEPYSGAKLDDQLDDQLRSFMLAGGASIDRADNTLLLSRIFLWYGGDFTKPQRMPTWLPPKKRTLLRSVSRWLDTDTRAWIESVEPTVVFRPYDWQLACSVA